MEKIDHPKVFISYAWGTNEYQQKVLEFAKMLKHDGIQVLLDKWSVTAGDDLNVFMEKCVNDNTVTNVIILLDEVYAEKADGRKGGVGAETQIISQEVYSAVVQDKFILVIFERNVNGDICKPVYLRSRSHYDLSTEEKFDYEYRKLIKHLFGREIYVEPELGHAPEWLDDDIEVPLKSQISISLLKENASQQVKNSRFSDCLESISKSIVYYSKTFEKPLQIPEEYMASYEQTKKIRSEYLHLINNVSYVENSDQQIGYFFEDTYNFLNELEIHGMEIPGAELGKIFIYELFLYTIALFLKKRLYSSAGYLLGRSYFIDRYGRDGSSFEIFNNRRCCQNLDHVIEKRDNTKYLSGTSVYLIQNLDAEFLSVNDLVTADEICANYSIYGNHYIGRYRWFPLTYWRDDEYDNNIKKLAKRLKSAEQARNFLYLFNYDSILELKKKFYEVDDQIKKHEFRNFGYQDAFNMVPLLGFYIQADEIGTIN